MLTSIYLQRRRIFFGMFFFFLAGLLDFGRFGMWDFPAYVIGMSVIFAMICGAIAALLIPFFPAYRQVFEIVGLSFFGFRLAQHLGAGDMLNFAYGHGNALGVILVCLGFTLLHHAIYGQWWARTPFRFAWTGRSRFFTAKTPEDVWARLVPNAQRPEEYYSGTLHEYRPVEGEDHTHVLRIRMGGPQFVEQLARVTEDSFAQRFTYDFSADVSAKNRDLNTGSWDLQLEAKSGGTAVRVVDQVRATTPANALLFWFDDLGGQVAVSMQRTLEGRRDPTVLGWLRRQVQAAA